MLFLRKKSLPVWLIWTISTSFISLFYIDPYLTSHVDIQSGSDEFETVIEFVAEEYLGIDDFDNSKSGDQQERSETLMLKKVDYTCIDFIFKFGIESIASSIKCSLVTRLLPQFSLEIVPPPPRRI